MLQRHIESAGVGDYRCANAFHLGGILHHPQAFDQTRYRFQLRTSRQTFLQELELCDSDIIGFESGAFDAGSVHLLEDRRRQRTLRDPNPAVHLLLRLHCIPRIGKQDGIALGKQYRAIASGKAGQVPDIVQIRNQEGVELQLGEQGGGKRAANLLNCLYGHQGMSSSLPAVLRPSRSRCATAASASG